MGRMCLTNRIIMMLTEIAGVVREAAELLIRDGNLQPRQTMVLGCSTSQVRGQWMGENTDPDVAQVIVGNVLKVCKEHGVFLAVQCCEHFNRALVVERESAQMYNWEEVETVPAVKAGGAAAAVAYEMMDSPVVVKEIQAHAGIDIGNTIIGMHLRRVATPIRIPPLKVGKASLTLVGTRPEFARDL